MKLEEAMETMLPYLTKDEAYNALRAGNTLYTPTWFFTMYDEKIYATCGYDNCCENDFENFEEFWYWHGNDELIIRE